MLIGVPKEIKTREYRVAATPAGVRQLVAHGHRVLVEHTAGEGSGISDDLYVAAGATIVPGAADAWGADMVIKVKEPLAAEYRYFREGLILYTYLHLAAEPALTRELVKSKVAAVAARAPVDVSAPGGRLLIVDDEPMILGALRRSFASDYQVTCVGDGRRALERIRAGERYDVILCDLMMPEITGMDLYAELGRTAPDQLEKVVFVTGGAFTPRAREFLERIPNARVEKPIDFQNLKLLLRNLRR